MYIGQLLLEDIKEKFIQLLKEFKCYFAWDYNEMPGLSMDLGIVCQFSRGSDLSSSHLEGCPMKFNYKSRQR